MSDLVRMDDVEQVTPAEGQEGWRLARSGLYVPAQDWLDTELRPTDMVVPYDRPVAVDLFAGAGGFSLGLHQAGFHVAAASDNDPWGTITYLWNLGATPVEIHCLTEEDEKVLEKAIRKQWKLDAKQGTDGAKVVEAKISGGNRKRPTSLDDAGCEHFFFGDARQLSGQMILEALGLAQGEVDAVCGGPPCQGYSVVGKRQVHDPRNSLVFEFMRLVMEIRPKTFIFENVPGLISMVTPEGMPVIDALARVAEDGDFATYEGVRQALLTQAGAGAVLRRSRKGEPNEKKRARRERAVEQLALEAGA